MVLIEIKMFYPVEVVPTQIEPYKMVLEFQDVKRRVCLSKYDAFQQKKILKYGRTTFGTFVFS